MAEVDSAWRLIHEMIKAAQPYQDILTVLGLLYGSKFAIKLTWNIYYAFKTFIWPLIAPEIDFVNKFGSWAVITGCTDGIGKAYAQELARRKMNIVLISRNMEKLQKTAHEIEEDFGVKTHIIQADFSEGREIYKNIASNLEDKEIGVLVNNVGVMCNPPRTFEKLSEKEIWDYNNINVAATTLMTHIVLPQMLKRRKGAIVNISSLSAIGPLPTLSVYSASKIFVDYFSQGLAFENRNKGIVVQSVMPSYVATELVKYSNILYRGNFLVPKASTYVRHAVRTLGRSNRTAGYWSHGLQNLFYTSLPSWMFIRLGRDLHSLLARF